LSDFPDISLKSLGRDDPKLRKYDRESDIIMLYREIKWGIFDLCAHRKTPDESVIELADDEDRSLEEFIFPIFFISYIDPE
jgi:hypothetical protein